MDRTSAEGNNLTAEGEGRRSRRILAVIPAAGRGRRLGIGYNKVFLDLAGRPVLGHTIGRLAACLAITDLCLVTTAGEEDLVRRLAARYGRGKNLLFARGGETRGDSVLAGIEAGFAVGLAENDLVLVHDAARCLVDQLTLSAAIESAVERGSGVAAVPVKDTVKQVYPGADRVDGTLDRALLRAIQTPQVFRAGPLRAAYREAASGGSVGQTDDAGVAEAYGLDVFLTAGSEQNIKITTAFDVRLATCFLQAAEGGSGE